MVSAAVWAPLTLWAVAALTVVGYIGTVGWAHSGKGGRKVVSKRNDEAVIMDLESRLSLAVAEADKYKQLWERATASEAVTPPCECPKCKCPACPDADAAAGGEGGSKSSSSSGGSKGNEMYQRFLPMQGSWGGIPMVGKEHPYGGGGSSVQGATLLGRDPLVATGSAESCKYLDVLFQHRNEGRCALIVDQDNGWRHSELPCTRPHCGDTHGEGFSPPFVVSYILNHSAPDGPWPARVEIPREKPLMWLPEVRDANIVDFLNKKKGAIKAAQKLIGRGDDDRNNPEPILVMCANRGHMGLLLNFFCSLRSAGLPTPKHFVVTPTAGLRDTLAAAGITAFYHEALGNIPDEPSESYGDTVFTKLMMLKQFSVWLALACGHDVLFQDVDLTWLKDPLPTLRDESRYYHVQFMDDGARNYLNGPYFVNSGFFYIRGADMDAFKFWDHVTMSMFGDANQRVVEKILHLHVMRNGLRARVLEPSLWTSGAHLSERRKAEDVDKTLERATVLHFCWTKNITVKYKKMTTHRAVFLREPGCFFDIEKCDLSKGKQWRDNVCAPAT